jgi:hypothetical protein
MPVEASGLESLHTKRTPLREFNEGYFFDQSVRIFDAAGVMYDPTVAEVDPVVGVAATVSD